MTDQGSEGDYQVGKTVIIPRDAPPQKGAIITKQDFDLLCEGADVSQHATRKYFCLGVCATSVAGVLGLIATGQYFIQNKPNLWTFGVTLVLLAVALATGVVAWFAHNDGKRQTGRSVYMECKERIEEELK